MYYYNTYYVDGVYRGYDTYVDEANPTQNFRSATYDNLRLYLSTTQGQLKRTYLKFDLSDSLEDPYAETYDPRFYDDLDVHGAWLYLYVEDIDLIEEPSEVMEAGPPIAVELWGVENDCWGEDITWNRQPHDPAVDNKIGDITDVSGEGEWIGFEVTAFVKREWEKVRGWGRWYQTEWWDEEPLEVGRFGAEEYVGTYDKYNDDGGVSTGYTLTGNGFLLSMVFDSGDNNTFWDRVYYDASGSPIIDVRFDNDTDLTDQDWIDVDWSGDYVTTHGRYAQYRVNPTATGEFYNITLHYTQFVSFVLREPEDWGPSSLQNLVAFTSRDNDEDHWDGAHKFYPQLRIVYSRRGRPGYAGEGLIDFGHIKYKTQNPPDTLMWFPNHHFTFEGGLIILQQAPGWYDTVLAEPADFITLSPADGNNVRLTVTRYQIAASSVEGESTAGTGSTSIRVQRERVENLVIAASSPNRSEVTIAIRTDHPRAWRDYLERLAAKLNYQLGGEWDPYGEYATYDYDSLSLTIKGKNLDSEVQDIYYSESVVWLDVSLGYWQGGKT
jgi:hypothetical protein